jgi:hypothetical protein
MVGFGVPKSRGESLSVFEDYSALNQTQSAFSKGSRSLSFPRFPRCVQDIKDYGDRHSLLNLLKTNGFEAILFDRFSGLMSFLGNQRGTEYACPYYPTQMWSKLSGQGSRQAQKRDCQVSRRLRAGVSLLR